MLWWGIFFFSSRRRHTRFDCDWSSDVCSSDLSPFDGKAMGCFADSTASKYNFTRAQQDAFATESVRRATQALQGGEFDLEVTPLTVKARKGETVIARDETPGTCDVSKIATMKPAFNKDGTVTAASSSSISDGAAALVLM